MEVSSPKKKDGNFSLREAQNAFIDRKSQCKFKLSVRSIISLRVGARPLCIQWNFEVLCYQAFYLEGYSNVNDRYDIIFWFLYFIYKSCASDTNVFIEHKTSLAIFKPHCQMCLIHTKILETTVPEYILVILVFELLMFLSSCIGFCWWLTIPLLNYHCFSLYTEGHS